MDIYWLINNDCMDMAGALRCVDHGLVPPEALLHPALQEPKTKQYSVFGQEDPNKGQQTQQSTPAPAAESAPAQEAAAAPALQEAPAETAEETGTAEEMAVTETKAAETESVMP